MNLALVWLAAYFIAGLLYVRRDVRLPLYRQPGYTATAKGRWVVRLLWLPASFRLMFIFGRFHRKYFLSEALPSYATFAALGIGGSLLASAYSN